MNYVLGNYIKICGNTLTDPFSVKTGIKQGCILGIQWTLTSYLEDLDFADDLRLTSSWHKDMQDKTSELDRTATRLAYRNIQIKPRYLRQGVPPTLAHTIWVMGAYWLSPLCTLQVSQWHQHARGSKTSNGIQWPPYSSKMTFIESVWGDVLCLYHVVWIVKVLSEIKK